MPGADGMSSKFMKNAFVGWTFTAGLYYPPDFDSTKLMPLKHLKPKGQPLIMNIRMMFPFTMICDSCGEYNYTGTKFTAKTEAIKGEEYLGLKVYRFYGRCRHCWAEFTFKTDPKNSDYTMESGGKRTYEAWKDADMMESQLKAEKERDAEQDAMKALEQKSVDVQAEMQRIEDLDAIRTMNKRLGARDQTIEDALEFLFKKGEREDAEEEPMSTGELTELDGFRDAQHEEKRRRLNKEVGDDEDLTTATASGSSASASSSSGSALDLTTALPLAAGNRAAQGTAAGAALASAVADRASKQKEGRGGIGARLSVKRKAPDEQSQGGSTGAASNGAAVASGTAGAEDSPRSPASGRPGEGASAPASSAACGALGLYDSDSS